MLCFALERARAQIAWKCGGLDAAGLGRRHLPSDMTLGGMLKHLTLIEDRIVSEDLTDGPIAPPWTAASFDADPEWDWHSAAVRHPLRSCTGVGGRPSSGHGGSAAQALADGGLDRLSKRTIESGESPNLRRVLVDLCEEYIRHLGHADLLREAVDGLVGTDPPQPA